MNTEIVWWTWDDLITPEMVQTAREVARVPPRPTGTPRWGVTRMGHVVHLLDLTAKEWAKLDVKKVTGDGWSAWYPVGPEDCKLILAERKRQGIKEDVGLDIRDDA